MAWASRRNGRLSNIPRLAGSWTGEIEIEGGETAELLPCLVEINQTWLQLVARFYTRHSHSVSISATVRGSGNAFGDFRYEYHVSPRTGYVIDGMVPHDGVARLRKTSDDWSTMEGDFFNDPHFARYGRYTLHRESQALNANAWLDQQQ